MGFTDSILARGLALVLSLGFVPISARAEIVARLDSARRPAAASHCPVPANKGAPGLNRKDPTFSYCAQYVDSECHLGPLGESMRGFFDSTGLAVYVRETPPADFAAYCPKYAELDEETQQRFWIWVFMSLSYEEGGCGEPSVVQAVRDYHSKHAGKDDNSAAAADSTYALAWKNEFRKSPDVCSDARIDADSDLLKDPVYPGERGCSGTCLEPSKIAGMRAASRCAMAMMARQLKRAGKLVEPKSYWQKFRRPGTLGKRLRTFGPCSE